VEPRLTTTSITRPPCHDDQSRMVSSLISIKWERNHPSTQTATTGLEGPKLQIQLSNATKGPNWSRPRHQLAPRHAKNQQAHGRKCCVDN
jgi:hypothetical protein